MPGLSIRARLALGYSALPAITVLILAGVSYPLIVWEYDRQWGNEQNMDKMLSSLTGKQVEQATKLVSNVHTLFPEYSTRLDRTGNCVRNGLKIPSSEHLAYYVQSSFVWLPATAVVQSCRNGNWALTANALENAEKGKATYETLTGKSGFRVRVLTTPVFGNQELIGVIQTGLLMVLDMYTMGRFLLQVVVVVIFLGLPLAAGSGWMLARRALAPIERMEKTVQRISAEHLDQRLEESGAGDELDRLSGVLNAMLERFALSFDQIRQFHVNASHQLKSPLANQQAGLGLALQKPRSPTEYQKFIKRALEQSKRMAESVKGLLLLAQADNGKLMPDTLKKVDVDQLLKEICKDVQSRAQSCGISVALKPLESCTVSGDPDLLRNTLSNLVDNAVKYTPDGGRVTLSLKCHENSVYLMVHDTGIGVPDDEKEKIFRPFYRGGSARDHDAKGTGLGLSLARAVVEAHGGTLQVASRHGEGSTFTVCLPQTVMTPPGDF